MKSIYFKIILIFISALSISAYSKDFSDGVFLDYSYKYYEMEENNYLFSDNKIEVIYFFNYKCIYSYKLHKYISFWLDTKSDNISFYNIPLSHIDSGLSIDLFILSKKFNYTFEEEILIYDRFLKELKSKNYDNLVSLYSKILGVSEKAIYSIMDSENFSHERDFIYSISKNYSVSKTPYAIINKKDKSYYVENKSEFSPINFIISINQSIKKQ